MTGKEDDHRGGGNDQDVWGSGHRGTRENKTTAKRAGNDSLVSQSGGDFRWRSIPFVGNENFVDKLRAEMNASAR
jgi:hypothetical protein